MSSHDSDDPPQTRPGPHAHGIGQRVLIARGPLQGLRGTVLQVEADQLLISVEEDIAGLRIRLPPGMVGPGE